jgi:aspartate aminotransferase, cytoplasmic
MPSTATKSAFKGIPNIAADRIFALTAWYKVDKSLQKVNLGQGAYRDGEGNPWILPCVAAARNQITKAGLFHEYLPILGNEAFRNAASRIVLGEASSAINEKRASYIISGVNMC